MFGLNPFRPIYRRIVDLWLVVNIKYNAHLFYIALWKKKLSSFCINANLLQLKTNNCLFTLKKDRTVGVKLGNTKNDMLERVDDLVLLAENEEDIRK